MMFVVNALGRSQKKGRTQSHRPLKHFSVFSLKDTETETQNLGKDIPGFAIAEILQLCQLILSF